MNCPTQSRIVTDGAVVAEDVVMSGLNPYSGGSGRELAWPWGYSPIMDVSVELNAANSAPAIIRGNTQPTGLGADFPSVLGIKWSDWRLAEQLSVGVEISVAVPDNQHQFQTTGDIWAQMSRLGKIRLLLVESAHS